MKRLFFVSSLFLVCYFFSYFSLCANAKNEVLSPKSVKKTAEPISFFIVIPSYNNALWYKQNLDSIAIQNYPNWHAYYINDHSTDKTGELVERYVKHPKYKKYMRRSKKFLVHDPGNTAQVGQKVTIKETRPISRRKRFVLAQ